MNGVNLLPWRLEKYRQLLFLFLLKMVAVLLVSFVMYIVFVQLQQQQKIALQTQQQSFDRQNARFTETVQHISQMKQVMQNFTELKAIEATYVEQILSLLPKLPFQQGELISFNFNEEGIQLYGFCLTQSEFEALHAFLSANFSSTKLTQFKPEQGRLVFQFDLFDENKMGEK